MMKIEISRLYLLNLLEKASTVSGSSSITPSLKSFLLEVGEGGVSKRDDNRLLHVLRTDRVLSVVAHTDSFTVLEDTQPYRVLVHAEKFLNLIRNLESENVTLNVPDDYSIQIEADSFKANWMSFDIKQFPDLPKCVSTKSMFKVKTAQFIKAVERVKYAAATDSVHVSLGQVFFSDEGCWAWDGFTYQQVDFKTKVAFSLPLEAVDVVKFAKLSGVAEMYVGVSDEALHFVMGQDMFVSRNPKVVAPSVDLLAKFVKKTQGSFIVEVAQLRKLIKRIGITSDNSRLIFDVKEKTLTVSGKDNLDNKSNESVPITFEGDSVAMRRFSVNWEFMDKALSAVDSKTATMYIDANHVIFRGDDCYGILPMLKG